jgi:hypothetical protein
MITVKSLPDGLSITEVSAPAAPAPDILRRIETLWDQEQARRGQALTNGRIFSLDRRGGATFTAWETQYKWWIAQRRDPGLFEALAVRPLAVSGVTRLADGLLFARRSGATTQDAGLWELAPSGGLDPTCRRPGGDLAAAWQLLNELEEELNISEGSLAGPPRAFAVMEDDIDHVVDIVFELNISQNSRQVDEIFRKMANREYTELGVVEERTAAAIFAQQSRPMSPASSALLEFLSKRR